MTSGRLVLRVDGGPGIGWGHVSRCLALAQAWIDGGGVATVASGLLPPEWRDLCDREGIDVQDPQSVDYRTAEWVVVDGYHLSETDRHAVESAGCRTAVVDDDGRSAPIRADVIVDQNLGATAASYPGRGEGTELLLGTRYALLRREFRQARGLRGATPAAARRLLVSMGGSPSPTTMAAFESVLTHELVAGAGLEPVTLSGVDGVASVLAGSDLAFAASGTTCWELCCVGVPAVLVPVAENQVPLSRALAAHGVALDAGLVDLVDPDQAAVALAQLAGDHSARDEMSRRGRALVDGRGAKRVVACLRASMLRLRRVEADDAALLFEWANDPVVRRAAFSSEPIPWAEHVAWLAGRLDDPTASIYLASSADDKPVGVVRFEQSGEDGARAEISVVVAQNRRGEGWGPAIIRAGVRRLFDDVPGIAVVTARVKPDNAPSLTSFDDAGFVVTGDGQDGAHRWVELEGGGGR